jgi:hypothetical protein
MRGFILVSAIMEGGWGRKFHSLLEIDLRGYEISTINVSEK